MLPGFDVIIPSYRNAAALRRCLSAWTRQDYPDFHLWICIDGEADEARSLVAAMSDELPPHALLTHPQEAHRGRSATRNLPLNHLSRPFTLFFDADLVPQPDLLFQHQRLLSADVSNASVGHICYQNADRNIWAALYNAKLDARRHRQPLPPWQFTSGNAAVPTEWFVEAGGFDEAFVEYGAEDADLMVRIARQRPVTVRYNRWAAAVGLMEKTLDTVLRERHRMGQTTLRQFAQKHPDIPQYFHWRKFTQPPWKWFLSMLWADRFFSAAQKGVQQPRLPLFLRKRLADYLTVGALFRGYVGRPLSVQ